MESIISAVLHWAAKYVGCLLAVILAVFTTLPSIVTENKNAMEANRIEQIERIESLSQAYESGSYNKVDESAVAGFDVQKAYRDGVKFNEVAYIATHNSYQLQGVQSMKTLYDDLEVVTFGLLNEQKPYFYSDTLTEQFNLGIRSIELDIETVVDGEKLSFICSHNPLTDGTTTCYDFKLALEEIKMWSDANPNHLPVTIIIEPKNNAVNPDNIKKFTFEHTDEFDALLREVLGDTLLTPAEMMGNHASLKEMREADDWLALDEVKGKVLFLLHEAGSTTEKYIAVDESIKTQAMFPMLRYDDRDLSYASFLLVNEPRDIEKYADELIYEKNLVVRTRVDSFGNRSENDRLVTMSSGAQILSTDYPPKADMTGVDYVVDFEPGTAKIIK